MSARIPWTDASAPGIVVTTGMPRLLAMARMESSSVRGPCPDGVLMMSWILPDLILSGRSLCPSETRLTTSA